MGRPLKEIDEKLVTKLAAIHCTMEEIALICNCSVDTLENRFSDVIKAAKATGKASLRRKMWRRAQEGNTVMLVWLSKNLLGMRDTPENEQPDTSKDDPEIPGTTKEEAAKLLELKRKNVQTAS